MDVASRLLPSIPTPTIPKRTRSLGAPGAGDASKGAVFIRKALPARVAPAVVCRNSRRENRLLFMNVPHFETPQANSGCHFTLLDPAENSDLLFNQMFTDFAVLLRS